MARLKVKPNYTWQPLQKDNPGSFLLTTYQKYNIGFFKGKLPKDPIILYNQDPCENLDKVLSYYLSVATLNAIEMDTLYGVIVMTSDVVSQYEENDQNKWLLHEMIHQYDVLNNNPHSEHGETFIKLANQISKLMNYPKIQTEIEASWWPFNVPNVVVQKKK